MQDGSFPMTNTKVREMNIEMYIEMSTNIKDAKKNPQIILHVKVHAKVLL
jgi:hypothetical protein